VIATNRSSDYRAYRFPGKLIPLVTLEALQSEPISVYGRGDTVRDWLFVEDHRHGVTAALERGRAAETYVFV
jgi:dTDP-glucose 4,6-dehydratase